ncbi:RNA polymerase sigma factor [Porticoccaceae bacterium]|nr:RNA polymerase sigma factor [Porticoccaceae bacterium]
MPGLSEKEQHKTNSSVLSAYKTHVEALRRFISRFVGKHDVEDVVQEAFLRAYNAESGKPIEQPKSYLFRIAKHVALNQLRQRSRKPTDYLEDFDSPDVLVNEWTLEDEIMAQQKLGFHCAAVAALPPKCRKVYLLRKVYGMSYKDIAATLQISDSTVEAHISKGYARCDQYIAKRMGEPSKRALASQPNNGRPQ